MPALYNNQVFPGGQEKTLTIAATAGNVATNLLPGTGLRWVIQRGRLTLTTDATVANRNILIQLTDGANITDAGVTGPTLAATGTTNMNLTRIRAAIGAVGIGFIESQASLGEVILTDADQLRITIVGGVAGDSYSGYLVVMEMAVS